MKKHVKRIISLVLAAIISCTGIVAFANDNIGEGTIGGDVTISPQFVAIRSCGRLLEKENTWGKLYIDGTTNTYQGYTAGVFVDLQKYNGSGWESVKTWTDAPNSTHASISEYYYVTSGTYRLCVTHYAYQNGTLVDVFMDYSDEVII